MSIPTIPPPLRGLLVQLEILSMVKPGCKINWGDNTFAEGTSWLEMKWWLGVFKRSRSGEGRKSTVTKINEIIDQTIIALQQYEKTPDFFQLIVARLESAKNGLLNLIITYQNCPETVAELRICVANISLQLDKYTQREPINRKSSPSPTPAEVIPIKPVARHARDNKKE